MKNHSHKRLMPAVGASRPLPVGDPPTLTIVAGANGSGKSTPTSGNLDVFGLAPLLDPDAFANVLHATGTGISAIAAGKEVLRLAKGHLARRENFAVETTLSGKNYLQMMRYARGIEQGFEVVPIYIGTESVEINLLRIARRVLAGGHRVPEADVRRRYTRGLQNLPTAIENADQALIFDNSKELGCQPIGLIGGAVHQWLRPLPVWAVELEKRYP